MAGAVVRDIWIAGPWHHLEVRANGARFHVAVGEGFSPTRRLILLLHGFAEFWWAWRHLLPALDRAGFSVAALDLRGYGGSDKTPHGYDPRTTAHDVSGVIEALGFSSAVLVGHDWGGMAAWATTAYAPTAVQALISVAAPHPLAFPWRAGLPELAYLQLPFLPERRMTSSSTFVQNLLRARVHRPETAFTPEQARRYVDALSHWPSPQCALRSQRQFIRAQLTPAGRSYRQALKAGVAIPVLSIRGDKDTRLPQSAVEAAGRWVRSTHEIQTIPNVGHLPHEEAPDHVSELILDWLCRHPRSPSDPAS